MSWMSGSDIAEVIIEAIKAPPLSLEDRKKVYEPIHEVMRKYGWDCENNVIGIDDAFDELMKEKFPDYFSDELDEDE